MAQEPQIITIESNLTNNIDSGLIAKVYEMVQDRINKFAFYLKKLIQFTIVSRTLEGKDIENHPFALNAEGEPPMLVRTGHMLRRYMSRSGGSKKVLPDGSIEIQIRPPSIEYDKGKPISGPPTIVDQGRRFRSNKKLTLETDLKSGGWVDYKLSRKRELDFTGLMFTHRTSYVKKTFLKKAIPPRPWIGLTEENARTLQEKYVTPFYMCVQEIMMDVSFSNCSYEEEEKKIDKFLNDMMVPFKELRIHCKNKINALKRKYNEKVKDKNNDKSDTK